MSNHRFFLFIGSLTDAAVSKIKAAGLPYVQKLLDSGPDNWDQIREYVTEEGLVGVIGRLNGSDFATIIADSHRTQAEDLLSALGHKRHIVFIHETVFLGQDIQRDEDDWTEEVLYEYYGPDDERRGQVFDLLERHGINVMSYRTNAELSVLAAAFVEDNERELLFRVYVPSGRIYAAEADRLLSLFRDWLTNVKRQRFRQDSYSTANGHVYEFFGDSEPGQELSLADQFDDFSRFLDLCVTDAQEAMRSLEASGVQAPMAADLVRRYGRDAKRLNIDLKHSRQAKLLALRQQLELELIDVAEGDIGQEVIDRSLERLAPGHSDLISALAPAARALPQGAASQVEVNVNQTIYQQIVRKIEGTVIQGLQGTANLNADAVELLTLVQRFGGRDAVALESAVHELEDEDARGPDRLAARHRLKTFLFKLGGKVEESVLNGLQAYIEGKLGA